MTNIGGADKLIQGHCIGITEVNNMCETIMCEICSASEAVRFLDNINENGEVCEDCFGEVYNGHGGYQ